MKDGNAAQDVSEAVLLRALVSLTVAEREERLKNGVPEATEIVLARGGLSHADIARITGKKPEAVRSVLRRNGVK